jgi:putative salt-induced outer membrane protein
MKTFGLWAAVAVVSGLAAPALAEWKGKSELGVVFARGNSDTDTANASLGMSTDLERWKHSFGFSFLRSATGGDKTAERYGGFWQSDFKLSDRDY